MIKLCNDKTCWLVFFVLFFYSVVCTAQPRVDLSFNQPTINSLVKLSNLQRVIPEIPKIDPDKAKEEWEFAISSPAEFASSLKNLFLQKDSNNFLNYYYKNERQVSGYLVLNLKAGIDCLDNLEKERSFFLFNGMRLKANIQNFYLFADWWSGHFIEDIEFAESNSPLIDSWYKKSEDGSKTYLDNLEGIISYRTPNCSISLGRSNYQIGNNISGSIILSDFCNEYGYFSGKLKIGKVSFSIMHASLIPDSLTQANNTEYADKYLVTHKIDWQPSTKLHFFLGEHVVYGERGVNPSYLLPHAFLRITEHNLRDRDNVLIFAGLDVNLLTDQTTYLNFIIDELAKSKFFSSWWGNKYALQIGHSIQLKNLLDSRITIEVTAIRPWLYTHKKIVNKFSQDQVSLGHPDGSNLIEFAGELNTKFSQTISLDLNYRYIKQGSVGNQYWINYETRPSDKVAWLEGDITEISSLTTVINLNLLAHHFLKVGLETSKKDDLKLDKKLYLSYLVIY